MCYSTVSVPAAPLSPVPSLPEPVSPVVPSVVPVLSVDPLFVEPVLLPEVLPPDAVLPLPEVSEVVVLADPVLDVVVLLLPLFHCYNFSRYFLLLVVF